MFASYHIPFKKRSTFPAGAYFAIMPRPLYRDTKPIAVIVPEPDPEGSPNDESARSDPEGRSSAKTSDDQYMEDLAKSTLDFRLRHARVQRPFTIMSPSLEELCRVEPKDGEGAHYVYAPDGTQLARIHRNSGRFFPWPRRARWHLEIIRGNASPALYSAPKGTIRAWTFFVILSPLWGALALFGLLASLLGVTGGAFVWGLPERAKWRTDGFNWGLDYRGVGDTYYLNTEAMDSRVAYAQAIVHSWTPRGNRKHRSE